MLFPDFDREALYHALLHYQKRDRRFGKVAVSMPQNLVSDKQNETIGIV
ncbi:hypothetical protein NDI52_07700 [Leptolyngbya sp. PL-A3]